MNSFGNLRCFKYCYSHISDIVCLLLSLCSTIFLDKLFDVNASLYAYSNSILSLLVFVAYLHTGLVQNFPTLIVLGFVAMAAIISFFSGMILDTIIQKEKREFEFRLQQLNNKL